MVYFPAFLVWHISIQRYEMRHCLQNKTVLIKYMAHGILLRDPGRGAKGVLAPGSRGSRRNTASRIPVHKILHL